jgi:hypothetical protein
MPGQTGIDQAWLLVAIPRGLDAALFDPARVGLIECTRAIDFSTGRNLFGKGYIQHYRAKQKRMVQAGER